MAIKNIQTEAQFHQLVADLEKISNTDANITSKLEKTQGKLDGRFVTLLKKIASFFPKVNLSTTNVNEVAKSIEKLAAECEKKGYFTTADKEKLTTVVHNLRERGKLYSQLSGKKLGNDKVFYKVFQTINDLKAKPIQPQPSEDSRTNNDFLREDLEASGLMTPLLKAIFEGNKDKVVELINQGVDPNVPDSTGCLPLHHAILVENLSLPVLEVLLQNPANVNHQNNEGSFPLHIALREGNIATAKFLLEKGADPEARDQKGLLPIHYAAQKGDMEMVETLLPSLKNINDALGITQNTKVTFLTERAITPLSFAAMSGNADLVKLLLERGADPTMASTKGRLPLHYAAISGNAEMIKLLMPLTNDLDQQDALGHTPLNYAVIGKHSAAVNLLIEKGAKADIPAKDGSLPLHDAVYFGNVEIAKALIPLTPNINQPHKHLTPLLIALKNNKNEVAKLLLEKGVNPNLPDEMGELPLHYAIKNEDLELSMNLASVTQNLNQPGLLGHTPLFIATDKRNHAMVKVLLEKGASADVADRDGNLPLHRALRGNNLELVKDLIAATKTLDKSGSIDETPLLIAIKVASPMYLEMLLKAGAKLTPSDKSLIQSYLIYETKSITKLLKKYGQI